MLCQLDKILNTEGKTDENGNRCCRVYEGIFKENGSIN